MQLYSYRLEAKKSGFEHFIANWGEDGVMRMPTACEHYEDKNPNWKEDADAAEMEAMKENNTHYSSATTESGDDLPF